MSNPISRKSGALDLLLPFCCEFSLSHHPNRTYKKKKKGQAAAGLGHDSRQTRLPPFLLLFSPSTPFHSLPIVHPCWPAQAGLATWANMGAMEDEMQHLKSVVQKLEARIRDLESRGSGDAPKAPSDVRMILIGPPGAGM